MHSFAKFDKRPSTAKYDVMESDRHQQRPSSGGGGRPRQNAANQLDFVQAMADFKVMFPDMDVDVIEAVLRSNNGAVDTTIDQLLSMTADNEELNLTKTRSSPPPDYQQQSNNNTTGTTGSLPSYQQAVRSDLILLSNTDSTSGAGAAFSDSPSGGEARSGPDLLSDMMGMSSLGAAAGHANAVQSNNNASGAEAQFMQYGVPLSVERNWRPRLLGKLPPDFLRITRDTPTRTGHSYGSPQHQGSCFTDSGSASQAISQEMLMERLSENQKRLQSAGASGGPQCAEANQILEDERFALMLQNEEFMAELRGNHEFLSALEHDTKHQASGDWDTEDGLQTAGGGARKKGGVTALSSMDEALFKERLRSMGKQSKAKFLKLAHMFSRRGGGAAAGAQRLLGHSPAPSKDRLLLNAEPLVDARESDDESDLERDQQGHSTTKVAEEKEKQ